MLGPKVFSRLLASLLTVSFVFSGLLFPLRVMALPQSSELKQSETRPYESRQGELLVKFEKGIIPEAFLKAYQNKFDVKESLPINELGIFKLVVDERQLQILQKLLKNNPGVEFIQPNYVYKAAMTPSDPKFSQQWGLSNIKADESWDRIQGEGVRIAVLDSGIDLTHPDLLPNLDRKADGSVNGYNVFNESNPLPRDENGHGTHVAGIIAAALNGQGGVGVAPKAKIMPVKVLDADGLGDDVGIAKAIRWAADNGAKVINLSLGGPNVSYVIRDAVNYAYGKGVVVVAAAGNEGRGAVSYPAALPGVISVAAVDKTNKRASFSNYGEGLDVSAPGVGILSTMPTYGVKLQQSSTGGYGYMSGTSMASPFVAGVAALILSADSSLTPGQVEGKIRSAAIDLGTAGYDIYYGAGLVNASGIVGGTPQPTPQPTPEPTPQPTPEPTPQPIPEPTPQPTPEPTPQPIPEPTPVPQPEVALEQKATIKVYGANVRSGPGTWKSVVATVHQGEVFTVYGSEGSWSKVKLASGLKGYMATSLIRIIEETGTINVSAVNVRTGPGTNYEKIGLVVRDEFFKILGAINNWYKVRLSSGTVGFMAGWLVKLVDQPDQQRETKATVVVSWANVRTGPSTNYNVLATISNGTQVTILNQDGNWYKIKLSNGRIGYIYKTLIQE